MADGQVTDAMALPAPRAGRPDGLIAAGLIAFAVSLLFVLAILEGSWLRAQPWSSALRTEDHVIDDPSAIAAWSRRLSLDQSVGESENVRAILRDLRRLEREQAAGRTRSVLEDPLGTASLANLDYFPRASLVMVDLPAEAMAPLLESGRIPAAGAREVLAGYLTGAGPLEIDGETFAVVGRLRPQIPAFVKSYVLPSHDDFRALFGDSSGGAPGSIVVEPGGRIRELIPELFESGDADPPRVHAGPVPTRPLFAWGTWGALLIAALGATLGFLALFRRLAQTRIPLIGDAMREIVLRGRLIRTLYGLYFGGFFGAMALGMQDPELNHLFTEYVSRTFTEGSLQYVGEAYTSGNIAAAAHATYYNNFVVQTVFLTTGLSLMPPFFLGMLKIMASFLVVGFAMAPLWSATASGMTYHVITLALELPPYILVAFGVAVWSHAAWGFLWSPVRRWYLGDRARDQAIVMEAGAQLPRALLVLLGCTLLSAVLLYVAAWYEATTLILFRGG
ncbi:MAG: hypothetical protein KF886_25625 [Candidatus Hydrogenedentes bacterium]|nr:hypothetical protein [Candidatus Hydrogenedentota bacterium]